MTDESSLPATNDGTPIAATGAIDAAAVRRMVALNGVLLEPERAAALVPFVQGLLEADARLAALDLGTLSTAGLPWAPFAAQLQQDGGSENGG